MKRTIMVLLLVLSASCLFAQDFNKSYGFKLGLTAHPTIGWLKPQVGKSNSVSLGFAYGLLADFNFAENYSFSTGLTITTVNGRSTEINTPYYTAQIPAPIPAQIPLELKYKLQYIELPLSLKLRTVKIGQVRWYGQFGLSNDFNIGAKQDIEVSGGSRYPDQKAADNIKFYRAGLIIGAGGEFNIGGPSSISAGLTFNNGFTDITEDKDTSVRNHYIGINFGVFF